MIDFDSDEAPDYLREQSRMIQKDQSQLGVPPYLGRAWRKRD